MPGETVEYLLADARGAVLRWLAIVCVLVVAGVLRLPQLDLRPMHGDEAINADKTGTLLEHGRFEYDPNGFHGPSFNYLSLIPARLHGAARYNDLTEATLRSLPAVFGVLIVAATLLMIPVIGFEAALAAALLAAISPAMVYYSRYYIHEMLLVFFSFTALISVCRYWRNRSAAWAAGAGVSLALMFATKETWIIALASGALAWLGNRVFDGRQRVAARRMNWGHCGIALVSGLAVWALLFSSFFSHPRGLIDSLTAYRSYFDLAGAVSFHTHPWHYYFGLLLFFRDGGPIWTEGLILFLALAGFAAALRGRGCAGMDGRVLRFLAMYTLSMAAIYAVIPYKTPWCLLGFLHGLILLAGTGFVHLYHWIRNARVKIPVVLLLVAAAAHLGWQGWAASFRYEADPCNPWVYAHTGRDVDLIALEAESLARAHPQGVAMPLQIITRENLWPLPWYLRRLTGVRWSRSVLEHVPSASLILITPDMEPALARKLYELPPPGQRELYMNIFDRPVQLRPGVEVRGYAAKTLWDEYLQWKASAADIRTETRK